MIRRLFAVDRVDLRFAERIMMRPSKELSMLGKGDDQQRREPEYQHA